jgi:hypothetical protein
MGPGTEDAVKTPPPPPGFVPEQTGAQGGGTPPPPPGFVPEGGAEAAHQARVRLANQGKTFEESPRTGLLGQVRNAADAVKSLARGAGEGIVKIADPRVPVTGGKWPPAEGSLLDMVTGPMSAEYEKAGKTQGWESLGHQVAAHIPIIGPAAAKAGEEFGRRNWGGGAVDAAAALAAGRGIARGGAPSEGVTREGGLLQRITRGPTRAEDVTVNPTTMATRELEAKVPRRTEPVTPYVGPKTELYEAEQGRLIDKAKKEALEAGRNAPGPWKPGTGPKPESPVSDLDRAVKEGRANRVSTRMPKPAALIDEVQQAINEGRASRLPTKMPDTTSGPRRAALEAGQTAPGPWHPGRGSAASINAEAAAAEGNRATVIPEPRTPFPGENPNYMASVEREGQLPELAGRGKPGAGTQLQQLGRPVLYEPKGAGYPPPRSRTLLDAVRESNEK